ncbi:pentachlorophenol monooxygenase [Aspergillus homomorphus CBS 101889]|uniref:Pentachlorophenol monooxygenase n=1 Tax=Aspergillus homomorphus (strain CBS 101889) TaxID=1450537 RepID=A0A395HGM8_ASPHC|nr:pentachlorophenol monooxygenase [Aspergillus homomorphus CBS 101889]RAL06910.1 pentachlorophenol monooxygenase [Aspergillus homomorphus CBS 101889]
MSSISNQILIVGGGPSGLLLAHELLRRQIPVRIVEKRRSPSHTSRAMTVHARSMEMFDHMGMASRLEAICLECPGNLYRFPGLAEADYPRTDYRVLPTRFPFYYKISQNDFEQVLREHLFSHYTVQPEYSTALVEAQSDLDWVIARIRLADGRVEESRYRYIVGCDGVHSTVRDAAGIKFEGKNVGVMGMMDVELTNVTFDDRWMNYFFNKDLFMNCTKMPGKYWRMYMSDPTGDYVHREDQQQAYQEVADQLGTGFQVGKPAWVTAWTVRNHIAERYRAGRLLICGDACHVHSPAGGQGMNCCMQDAFNLGWKLAAVVKGHADEQILDTYERERKPIGEQVSQGAAATHKIVMGFGIPPEDRLALTQTPDWEARTTHLVSGLSHNYRDVTVLPPGLTPVSGPKPGERAPDAILVDQPRRRLYDLYRRPQFTLLVVSGTDDPGWVIDTGVKLRTQIDSKFPGQVATILISRETDSRFDFDHHCCDAGTEFVSRYEIPPGGRLVLVRSDLYLAMACQPGQWELIDTYLEQWFLPATSR